MYKKINIFCLFAILFFLAACEKPQPPAKEILPTPVTAKLPEIRDVSVYVEGVGILEPSYYIDIRPQVSGSIEKIFIQEGEWVKAGDPLFKLDSKPYEIKLKEAKAQLLMDEVAYEAAQKKRERYYSLAQKDLVAQVEWDEIELSVAKAKAVLEHDNARVEDAMLELERCIIYSPEEGRIGQYDIHPGTLVSREQILSTLSRNDPLIVNFNLTEKDFSKLQQIPEDSLTLELKLLCNQECFKKGNITYLDGRFDNKSGMIFLRGKIENKDQALRPGQTVSVRVPIAVKPNQVIIPQKAIKYNQQGPYVYAINKENSLEFRQLILGEESGNDEIAVLEGISPTEYVVTSSHGRLSPGLKVEVQP